MAKPNNTDPNKMSPLEAALYYARERDWAVVPCGKDGAPLTPNGILDATTDTEQITELWTKWPDANIGFDVYGSEMVVLEFGPDVDWDELEDKTGPLPDTYLYQDTPGGGQQLFFAVDIENCNDMRGSESVLAKHVNVRSSQCHVLLAPSKTPEGAYTLAGRGNPTQITFKASKACFVAGWRRDELGDNWIIEWDLPENLDRAIEWLKHDARVVIQGQKGRNLVRTTAAHCKSLGIGDETTVDLMRTFWNPRCQPPWEKVEEPEDEYEYVYDPFEALVISGYYDDPSPPGHLTDAYRAAKNKLDAKNHNPLDTMSGIIGQVPAPYIIDGILTKGSYSVAYGRTKVGKSFCELGMALSVASGEDWLGCETKITGPVIYLAAEGKDRLVGEEGDVAAWCKEFDVNPRSLENKFFLFGGVAKLNTKDGRSTLRGIFDEVERMAGQPAIYLVIDTLTRSMAGGTSNEQSVSDVQDTVKEITSAYSEMGAEPIAVTLIAHEGKSQNGAKGLSEIEDNADHVRRYIGNVREGTTRVHIDKLKRGPDGNYIPVEYKPVFETLVATVGAVDAAAPTKPKTAVKNPQREREIAEAKRVIQDMPGGEITPLELARKVFSEVGPSDLREDHAATKTAVDTLSQAFARGIPELLDYVRETGGGKKPRVRTFGPAKKARKLALLEN